MVGYRTMAWTIFTLFTAAGCASTAGSGSLDAAAEAAAPVLYESSPGEYISLTAKDLSISTEIAAPVERVWRVLPEVYSTLGIAAEVLSTRDRVFGARRFTGSRIGRRRADEYVRCGFQGAGPLATAAFHTRLSILSQVARTSDTSATIATQVSGSAQSVEGTSTASSRCVSNGRLEKEIAALVAGFAQP